jgi:hypothetical protein
MMRAHKSAGPQGLEPVVYVTLDFQCCGCGGPVSVTLRCEGRGMQGEAARQVAALPVACPGCGQENELFFEPRGRVRGVRPYAGRPGLPEPSLN